MQQNTWTHVYDAALCGLVDMLLSEGHGSSGPVGYDQLGPDASPIVWTQHLPGYVMLRLALNLDAKLGTGLTTTSQNLIEVGVIDPALLSQNCTRFWGHVHEAGSYSVTLQTVKALRYRLSV